MAKLSFKNLNTMYNYKVQLCPQGFQWHITRLVDGKQWTVDNSQMSIEIEGCQLHPHGDDTPHILCKRLELDLKDSKPPKGKRIRCTVGVRPTWVLDAQEMDFKSFAVLRLYGKEVYTNRHPKMESVAVQTAGAAPVEIENVFAQHLISFNEN